MKRSAWIAIAVMAWVSPLLAEDSRVNFFAGYAYRRAHVVAGHPTNLNGWDVSVEARIVPHFSAVTEFGGNYGSTTVALPPIPPCPVAPCLLPASVTVHLHGPQFFVGPRFYGSVGNTRIFGHVLFGAGGLNPTVKLGPTFGVSDDTYGEAIGGGYDYRLDRHWAWRTQVDYLHMHADFGNVRNDARVLTGIVARF
jgi:hypothetical protein